MGTFLKISFMFLSFTQICFAQLEFYNDQQPQKMSNEQLTNTAYVNIDSMMLDSIISNYVTENIPGAASLIIKENGVAWNKNYGFRNIEMQLPVEDSTVFIIASISKTILVTAVMQLWENSLIDLNGNINNYLPSGFIVKNPNYPYDTITVKMLMTHSSSLKDDYNILLQTYGCGDYPVEYDSFLVNYFSPGGIYYSSQNFYTYRPGLTYNYSNLGSSLLALMVENLSGRPYAEYVRDSIFIPLSMNSSSFFLEGMDTSKVAVPYIGYPPQATCHTGMAYWPIGQLRTTKLELSNFASAYLNYGVFNNHRILESSTIALMLSDKGFTTYWEGMQGLIWFTDPAVFNTVWGHTGGWYGCAAAVYLCMEENWSILFFTNRGDTPDGAGGGFIPTLTQMANYAHLFGNIYALRSSTDKQYARINVDPVSFRTRFSNRYNHPFTPHLIYANTGVTEKDSLPLFDNGLHGDSFANDGIYGGIIPSRSTEDFYYITVSTIDNQTNKYFSTPDQARFTTAGPVTLDSLQISKGSSYLYIKPFVTNEGSNLTITGAKIKVICNDPWVSAVEKIISLPAMPPDISVGSLFTVSISYIDSLFPGYLNIKTEIMLDGWTYWTDSIKVTITDICDLQLQPLTYKLEQNYPNPFNSSSNIKYSIQNASFVLLKIYNTLGEEIETLINEEKPAGSHEITWIAANLPSGVYFYQLRAGDFITAKKMILMK